MELVCLLWSVALPRPSIQLFSAEERNAECLRAAPLIDAVPRREVEFTWARWNEKYLYGSILIVISSGFFLFVIHGCSWGKARLDLSVGPGSYAFYRLSKYR